MRILILPLTNPANLGVNVRVIINFLLNYSRPCLIPFVPIRALSRPLELSLGRLVNSLLAGSSSSHVAL